MDKGAAPRGGTFALQRRAKMRRRLESSSTSAESYLDTFRALGLLATVSEMAPFDHVI